MMSLAKMASTFPNEHDDSMPNIAEVITEVLRWVDWDGKDLFHAFLAFKGSK